MRLPQIICNILQQNHWTHFRPSGKASTAAIRLACGVSPASRAVFRGIRRSKRRKVREKLPGRLDDLTLVGWENFSFFLIVFCTLMFVLYCFVLFGLSWPDVRFDLMVGDQMMSGVRFYNKQFVWRDCGYCGTWFDGMMAPLRVSMCPHGYLNDAGQQSKEFMFTLCQPAQNQQ